MSTCVIPQRFNGPAASANGGYACGTFAVAARPHVPGPAAVTLHLPPPLAAPLRLEDAGRRTHVWCGDALVATVQAFGGDVDAPAPVTAATADAAREAFLGLHFHPFPTCFVCGGDRPEGDGIALAPGLLDGRAGEPADAVGRRVACTWTPDDGVADATGAVPEEVVWAVLDCPGGWTAPQDRPRVLGRMAVQLDRLPAVGRRHVVVGSSLPGNGRSVTSLTALYDEAGRLLAKASATWLEVGEGGLQAPVPA